MACSSKMQLVQALRPAPTLAALAAGPPLLVRPPPRPRAPAEHQPHSCVITVPGQEW